MQLTISPKKTKKFLCKTLKNLTSFFLERFTRCCATTDDLDLDLELELDKNAMVSRELMKQEDACSQEIVPTKIKQELRGSRREGSSSEQSSESINAGCYALAQKMKELDMVDEGDMEHELDVEEALHYYSRLRSPVYLDIVDNFFMDMYSEFNVPQRQQSFRRISNSKRRKGSFRF